MFYKTMLKRFSLLFSFIIACVSASANMASPWIGGNPMCEAYSSKDIDILHESLHVRIIDFYTAKYAVIYTVKSDRAGKQIPLVFDTMIDVSEGDGFRVWVDDKDVAVSKIPSSYEDKAALSWIDSLDNHLLYSQENVPNLIGLKYFEVDLSEGEHAIRVEYTVRANVYVGNPVREFTLRYNLAPARFWRTFGGLDIEIDITGLDGTFETNLPAEKTSLTDAVTHLHFSDIPSDEFVITYTPQVGWFANVFVVIGHWLVLAFILVLGIVHVYLTLRYRIRKPTKRFSLVVIVGGILAPILYLCLYVWSYSLIDVVVGEYASGRHGYVFFIFLLYPVVMPIYLLLIWMIDKMKKDKIKKDVSI